MTEPLTIDLAGRRLPALRAWESDPYGRWEVDRAAVVPAGETSSAVGISWTAWGTVCLVLAEIDACLRAVDTAVACAWQDRAEGLTEAEALAQIVEWSR